MQVKQQLSNEPESMEKAMLVSDFLEARFWYFL